MNKVQGFQFKQFFIAHDKCAMKVNTDSILLGTTTNITNCLSILDIGTGSGLVAIILAQRTAYLKTQIIGLEIDPNAYQQAYENIQQTKWKERLSIQHIDFLTFNPKEKFDLIISNPPYFENGPTSKNIERNLARKILSSHFNWLIHAKELLNESGRITFILPLNLGIKLIEQAKDIDLFCIERWDIFTKSNKEPKRIIITFCKSFSKTNNLILTIYDKDNNYTEQFKNITKDFYLAF